MITWVVTHPELSESVIVESPGEHSDTFIANNVWHYVLREFDVAVDRHAFKIERKP